MNTVRPQKSEGLPLDVNFSDPDVITFKENR